MAESEITLHLCYHNSNFFSNKSHEMIQILNLLILNILLFTNLTAFHSSKYIVKDMLFLEYWLIRACAVRAHMQRPRATHKMPVSGSKGGDGSSLASGTWAEFALPCTVP